MTALFGSVVQSRQCPLKATARGADLQWPHVICLTVDATDGGRASLTAASLLSGWYDTAGSCVDSVSSAEETAQDLTVKCEQGHGGSPGGPVTDSECRDVARVHPPGAGVRFAARVCRWG